MNAAEKWTSFADKKSGVNPFLHEVAGSTRTLLHYLVILCLLSTLWPMRLIVRASLYMYTKQWGLLKYILPARVNTKVHWLLNTITLRIYLAFFGFYYIDARVIGGRRRGGSHGIASEVGRGDLIISNRVSWTQILYLSFRFNPVYAFPATDYTDVPTTVPVRRVDLPEAIRIMKTNATVPSAKAQPLSDVIYEARRVGRPVVVFPEGCNTNGRGVLSFLPVLDSNMAAVPPKVSVTIGFKLADTRGISWINTGFENHTMVDRMAIAAVPIHQMTARAVTALEPLTPTEKWWTDARKILAQSIQLPALEIGLAERKEFLKAFRG